MFFIINQSALHRELIINHLIQDGIGAVFHYIPLHSSPFGLRHSKTHQELQVTNQIASNIIRLPLWINLSQDSQKNIANSIRKSMDLCVEKLI